jgi:hypothetical protein
MRKFLIGSFTAALVPLVLVTALIAGISSLLNPELLKSQLLKSGIYEATASYAGDFFEEQFAKEARFRPLVNHVKAEVTSEYLKGKAESSIDNTFSYLEGETEELPSVSFADLSQNLRKRSSLFTTLFRQAGLETYLDQPQLLLGEQESAEKVRENYYQFLLTYALWALWILIAILLLIVFLVAKRENKIKVFGRTLLIISVFGLLLASLLFLRAQSIQSSSEPMPNIPLVLQAPLQSLLAGLLAEVARFNGILYLAFAVFGLSLYKGKYLISKFSKEADTGVAAK